MRLVLTLALFLGMPAMLSADTFLYVSDSGQQEISVHRMDEASGKLAEVARTNVGAAPGSLAVDPARKHLFASLRNTNSIGSFAIAGNGKLSPVNATRLESGANAAYVATDHTGKYVLSASYAGGRIVVHAIDSEGRISEKPLQAIETAKTAHAAVIPRDNRWVFVPHVEPNAVFQFRFDASTGKLSDGGRAPGGRTGAGPRHLAVHPSQKFAFSSDETGNSITLYSLDAESGLKPLKTISTLPPDFSGKNTTADVKVHPSGKFVWVSNRGHDSLAGFQFDESKAELAAIGQTPTEKTPRSFELDPSGKFLFAAGEGSGKLAAYKVDQATGKLERMETYEVGKSLTWVLAVQTK